MSLSLSVSPLALYANTRSVCQMIYSGGVRPILFPVLAFSQTLLYTFFPILSSLYCGHRSYRCRCCCCCCRHPLLALLFIPSLTLTCMYRFFATTTTQCWPFTGRTSSLPSTGFTNRSVVNHYTCCCYSMSFSIHCRVPGTFSFTAART